MAKFRQMLRQSLFGDFMSRYDFNSDYNAISLTTVSKKTYNIPTELLIWDVLHGRLPGGDILHDQTYAYDAEETKVMLIWWGSNWIEVAMKYINVGVIPVLRPRMNAGFTDLLPVAHTTIGDNLQDELKYIERYYNIGDITTTIENRMTPLREEFNPIYEEITGHRIYS